MLYVKTLAFLFWYKKTHLTSIILVHHPSRKTFIAPSDASRHQHLPQSQVGISNTIPRIYTTSPNIYLTNEPTSATTTPRTAPSPATALAALLSYVTMTYVFATTQRNARGGFCKPLLDKSHLQPPKGAARDGDPS